MRTALATIILWILALNCAVSDGPARPWKLAFVRSRDIWTANGDGSGQNRLIRDGSSPAWSPDRKRIAFARKNNVWTANADGSSQRKLTHFAERPRGYDVSEVIEITWRPGRDQVTFSHTEELLVNRTANRRLDPSVLCDRSILAVSIFDTGSSGGRGVYEKARFDTLDYAGTAHFSYNASPCWSGDGNTLLFVRNGDIWIAQRVDNYDGGRPGWDVTRLSPVARYDEADWRADTSNEFASHLTLSPDGRYVAYGFGRSEYDAYLYLLELKPNGTGIKAVKRRVISEGSQFATWPSFSPDSSWVAYAKSGEPEDSGIWAVNARTGARVRLIGDARQPCW